MDNIENKNTSNRLKELGGSDFEIKDEQPNIKGWKVKNDMGQIIGEVNELIFDTQALKVRYIVLDLDDNEWNMDSRHVLVPIGMAEIDQENDDVLLPAITLDQILLLPEYDKNNLTLETETLVRNAFASTGTFTDAHITQGAERTDDFYNHDHFNEERLYKRRRGGDAGKIPDDPSI